MGTEQALPAMTMAEKDMRGKDPPVHSSTFLYEAETSMPAWPWWTRLSRLRFSIINLPIPFAFKHGSCDCLKAPQSVWLKRLFADCNILSLKPTTSVAPPNQASVNRPGHVLICRLVRPHLWGSRGFSEKRNVAARLGTWANRPWDLVDPLELLVYNLYLHLGGAAHGCSDTRTQLVISSHAETHVYAVYFDCPWILSGDIRGQFLERPSFSKTLNRKRMPRMDIDTYPVRFSQGLSHLFAGRKAIPPFTS